MKTQKKTIISLILVMLLLILTVGCQEDTTAESLQKKKLDRWLTQHIETQDRYTFMCLLTFSASDTSQASSIPNETYEIEVTIDKTTNSAKFELKQIKRWYSATQEEEITYDTESFEDQIYYLTVADDTVSIYLPTPIGYNIMICKDPEFADQIAAILFPTDLSIFEGEHSELLLSVENADVIVRNYKNNLFYGPFRELSSEYEDIPLMSYIELAYILYQGDHEGLPALSIIEERGSTELLNYAYRSIMHQPVPNSFTRNNVDFHTTVTLNFYDTMLDAEPFSVPALMN